MSKILILKAKYPIKKEETEQIEKELQEKTGIKTVIIDSRFDIEIAENEGDK